MRTVPLGNTGVDVSIYCLGAMYLGTRNDAASSYRLLDLYMDAGGFFIDTANIYAHWVEGFQGGESETLLGEWMRARGNRGRIFLATKVGFQYPGVTIGLSARADRGGVRQEPAPAGRRHHRPLLRPRGRPQHAAGGDAGGL